MIEAFPEVCFVLVWAISVAPHFWFFVALDCVLLLFVAFLQLLVGLISGLLVILT